MFTKTFRFNLTQLIFNYIFRLENDLDHDLKDILLQSTDIDEQLALENTIQNYASFKSQILPFLADFGWEKTPFLSRAILITFVGENELVQGLEQNKMISEYLHLTQDLAGADSVALVHAVIGKITNKIIPEIEIEPESEDESGENEEADFDQQIL